jgi:hypothetical protein
MLTMNTMLTLLWLCNSESFLVSDSLMHLLFCVTFSFDLILLCSDFRHYIFCTVYWCRWRWTWSWTQFSLSKQTWRHCNPHCLSFQIFLSFSLPIAATVSITLAITLIFPFVYSFEFLFLALNPLYFFFNSVQWSDRTRENVLPLLRFIMRNKKSV